jgi:hypothetical protein
MHLGAFWGSRESDSGLYDESHHTFTAVISKSTTYVSKTKEFVSKKLQRSSDSFVIQYLFILTTVINNPYCYLPNKGAKGTTNDVRGTPDLQPFTP